MAETKAQVEEQETKVFTPAQTEMLTEKYRQFQLAQAGFNEFLGYLAKEHGVAGDSTWQLTNDLTGFVHVPAPEAAD